MTHNEECQPRRHRIRTMPIVVGICGMAGFVGSAPAGSLVITSLGSTTAAGLTTYSYQLSLEPHSALFKGDSTPPVGGDLWSPDFGQIFDFAGYKLGSITFTPNATSGLVDGDLAASTPLKDSGPEALSFFAPVAGDDTVSLVNLKLDFNRDDPLINNDDTSSIVLGTLSAKSIYSNAVSKTYITTNTEADGNTGYKIDSVLTPDGPVAVAAPLPQTIWGGLGFFGVMGLTSLRRGRR